ncbi:37S ribosomal protein, mitochondrial [Thelotrema lepadinum]|nr:37S ribosomal protein, mitochondrial [Thelotrema lepadinum]
MIVRQAVWRQGRRLVAQPRRSSLRSFASEVDRVDLEAQQNLQEQIRLFTEESQQRAVAEQQEPKIPLLSHAEQLVQRHKLLKAQEQTTATLGTRLTPFYEPHTLITNPPRPRDITLELLLASQAHMGHATSLWNPANSRYIFGVRQGMHIISLEATAAHLRRACRIVSGVAERGGIILFVGTRAGQERTVVQAAKMAKGCHLFTRWIPGSITNGQQILKRAGVKLLDHLDREVKGMAEELEENAPALKPDLVVCLNPLENWVLLHECGLHTIPTIGIVDTDADPSWVTYPIPANDDSLRCVQVIAGVLGRAGEEGQQKRLERAKGGEVTYEPANLDRFKFEQ